MKRCAFAIILRRRLYLPADAAYHLFPPGTDDDGVHTLVGAQGTSGEGLERLGLGTSVRCLRSDRASRADYHNADLCFLSIRSSLRSLPGCHAQIEEEIDRLAGCCFHRIYPQHAFVGTGDLLYLFALPVNPIMPIVLPPMAIGIMAIGFHYSTYMAEVSRSGDRRCGAGAIGRRHRL